MTPRDENSLSDLKMSDFLLMKPGVPAGPPEASAETLGGSLSSGLGTTQLQGVFHGSHPRLLIKIDLRLINRVVPGNQSDG